MKKKPELSTKAWIRVCIRGALTQLRDRRITYVDFKNVSQGLDCLANAYCLTEPDEDAKTVGIQPRITPVRRGK